MNYKEYFNPNSSKSREEINLALLSKSFEIHLRDFIIMKVFDEYNKNYNLLSSKKYFKRKLKTFDYISFVGPVYGIEIQRFFDSFDSGSKISYIPKFFSRSKLKWLSPTNNLFACCLDKGWENTAKLKVEPSTNQDIRYFLLNGDFYIVGHKVLGRYVLTHQNLIPKNDISSRLFYMPLIFNPFLFLLFKLYCLFQYKVPDSGSRKLKRKSIKEFPLATPSSSQINIRILLKNYTRIIYISNSLANCYSFFKQMDHQS